MVRKVWIAVLVLALCLHLGVGVWVVYVVTFYFPTSFGSWVTWLIIFAVACLIMADCIALNRRVVDDDGECLTLNL